MSALQELNADIPARKNSLFLHPTPGVFLGNPNFILFFPGLPGNSQDLNQAK